MKNTRHHFIKKSPIRTLLFVPRKIISSRSFLAILTGLFFANYTHIFPESIDWSILTANDTLTLFFKDKRVGMLYYETSIDSVKEVIMISSRVEISTSAGITGNFSSMDLVEKREYNFNGTQSRAHQTLKSSIGSTTWELHKSKAGEWTMAISAGGVKKSLTVKNVTGNLTATYAIQNAIVNGEAKVGEEWQDTVFDLTSAANIIVTIKCIRIPDKVNPYYVFINHDNIMERDERWEIDTKGRTVLQEVPPFFTAKRYSRRDEEVKDGANEKMTTTDLIDLFKVTVDRAQGDDETIALSLKSGAKIHESARKFYAYKNGQYVLRNLQSKCQDRLVSEKIEGKSSWLSSTVTIQSDHPEIQKKSAKLKGSKKKRCKIIKHFNTFVYKNIKKEHVATFSNAYETLKSGVGDCGEHATLLAALMRSVGIESNVVLGLVYMPYRQGYFYHAWVAAYADDLLFVDPALGEFPASKGYIPLVIDDDGTKIVHLASLIERIEISYVPKLKK